MENYYLIIVVILFLLAISDLIVGVANDAVNFLVGAIGSKAAPFWVIMLVASAGVIVGATFSTGMMEIARKGIFNPGMFTFEQIMLIFVAVMLTDVLLLDLFNTFGFPTSTTVSLVFELLGAAVAIALIKMSTEGSNFGNLINSEKILAIVGGILLSVVVAFIFGSIIQFFARLIFSFNLKKTFKYFGAIWGGVSIAIIMHFLVVKGLKGSSFKELSFVTWALHHQLYLFLGNIIVWTIVLQTLYLTLKINSLKIVVLAGTFALAMAFAGNDLVNFIGAPLAGFSSYQIFNSSNIPANSLMMNELSNPVNTPTLFLLLAGMVMIATLWLSKKAKSVTETSIELSRQSAGYERFGSTLISRSLVRAFIHLGNFVDSIIPKSIKKRIENRYEQNETEKIDGKNVPAFDLVRASVNLVVSSILIAIGTSFKLPLSTTYVTFMVAMSSSFADGAWGRESAVYRVTGVLSVIGGWFITGMVAFTVAFVIANILFWGGIIALSVLLTGAIILIYRTRVIHRRRELEKQRLLLAEAQKHDLKGESLVIRCTENVTNILSKIPEIFNSTITGLNTEDRELLKKMNKKVKKLNKETNEMKDNIHSVVVALKDEFLEFGHYYVQIVDYLREISNSIFFTVRPCYDHIDNNHEGIKGEQILDLEKLNAEFRDYFQKIIDMIKAEQYINIDALTEQQQILLESVENIRRSQLQRIKDNLVDTRSSLLYLNLLAESKNVILFTMRLTKSHREFIVRQAKSSRYNKNIILS